VWNVCDLAVERSREPATDDWISVCISPADYGGMNYIDLYHHSGMY